MKICFLSAFVQLKSVLIYLCVCVCVFVCVCVVVVVAVVVFYQSGFRFLLYSNHAAFLDPGETGLCEASGFFLGIEDLLACAN